MITTNIYSPDKQEIQKILFKLQIKQKIILILLLLACYFILTDNFSITWVIIIILFPLVLSLIQLKYLTSTKTNFFSSSRYVIADEDKISIYYSDGNIYIINIKNISAGKVKKNGFIIKYSKTNLYSFLYIPYYVFKSPEDLNYFKDIFIKNNMHNIKFSKEEIKTQPSEINQISSFFYISSIATLIPFIGVLAGTLLLLYAILRYKNKTSIIIGCSGLIISLIISIYAYKTIYSKEKVDLAEKQMQIYMDKMLLKRLIKEIELYKIQKGEYPYKLENVSEQDPNIVIEDFIFSQLPKKRKKVQFYYQKSDSCYILFSKGFDTIAFTGDDIYPSLS
ncbi:MAG: hypothetical protein KA792_04505, partial [Bacteroidales bacterium]|nr:hypothetical protein [Bacteroidales bacterium]